MQDPLQREAATVISSHAEAGAWHVVKPRQAIDEAHRWRQRGTNLGDERHGARTQDIRHALRGAASHSAGRGHEEVTPIGLGDEGPIDPSVFCAHILVGRQRETPGRAVGAAAADGATIWPIVDLWTARLLGRGVCHELLGERVEAGQMRKGLAAVAAAAAPP